MRLVNKHITKQQSNIIGKFYRVNKLNIASYLLGIEHEKVKSHAQINYHIDEAYKKNKVFGKKLNKEVIAKIIEHKVNYPNTTLKVIGKIYGVSERVACSYLTRFYFPYKGDNQEVLVLKSKMGDSQH